MSGLEVIEIAHNVMMKGMSGYEHQIDVMYRIRIWLTELLVLVECKQYERRVGVDELLEFRSRLEDLRAHKGIFVTSSDYQSGAVEFARANRIALLVVKGTMHRAVLYSLDYIPIEEQCQGQAEYLHKKYATQVSGRADRVSIDKDHHRVLVQKDGVVIQLEPWELHTSMLYKRECHFGDVLRSGEFFERAQFSRLPLNKLLKSLVIDELLGDPAGGQPAPTVDG